MKSYDSAALLEIANPRDIASYFGAEIRQKGINVYIPCPAHEKTIGKADTRIGNCVLTKRGFHCFACNAHGDVFDMVSAYTGCSYPEALKIVGDIYGGADSYLEKGSRPRNYLPQLSPDDLELIGLRCNKLPESNDNGKLLFNVTAQREGETSRVGCVRKGNEYVLYQKGERENLRTLQERDQIQYLSLIERKAKEAQKKYYLAKRDCGSSRTKIYQDLLVLFQVEVLSTEIVEGMQLAFENKRKRAREIELEYRKRKEKALKSRKNKTDEGRAPR